MKSETPLLSFLSILRISAPIVLGVLVVATGVAAYVYTHEQTRPVDPETLDREVQLLKSFSTEGALLAEMVHQGRLTDSFVRVHAEHLAKALASTRDSLDREWAESIAAKKQTVLDNASALDGLYKSLDRAAPDDFAAIERKLEAL